MHAGLTHTTWCLIPALVLSLGSVSLPITASATLSNTAECSLGFTITFSNALSAIPGTRSFSVSGNGGTCTGLVEPTGSGPDDFATTVAQSGIASCAELVDLSGQGTLTLPNQPSLAVDFKAVGPSVAQAWTFVASGGATAATAGGVFTWTNATEIEDCPAGGTTMTLNGELVVAA
jgi:hypothetical protein